MKTQVQAHQHKAPAAAEHMGGPGDGASALDGQSGKQVPGEDHAAGHGTQHRRKNQQNQRRLNHAGRRIAAFEQVSYPGAVQNVMDQEQKKHCRPQQFVRQGPNQLAGHQKQECQRHEAVGKDSAK